MRDINIIKKIIGFVPVYFNTFLTDVIKKRINDKITPISSELMKGSFTNIFIKHFFANNEYSRGN